MKRSFIVAITASACLVALASPVSSEDPPPPHQHFVVTANGDWHPIGPYICDDRVLTREFLNFHYNVHKGQPGQGARDRDEHPRFHNDPAVIGRLC